MLGVSPSANGSWRTPSPTSPTTTTPVCIPSRTATRSAGGKASRVSSGLIASIDVQKMNWKCSTGVHEQTGVCLHRHCGQNGTGGYTREPQNTGQFCDCQSFTHQVATGLPQRRCAFGAADHGVDRPPRAPRALGGPVRALGPQCLLSLRLAEGLSAAWPGEFVLPP